MNNLTAAIETLKQAAIDEIVANRLDNADTILAAVRTLRQMPVSRNAILTVEEAATLTSRRFGYIDTVKAFRARTGFSLKESKDVVDNYIVANGLTRGEDGVVKAA